MKLFGRANPTETPASKGDSEITATPRKSRALFGKATNNVSKKTITALNQLVQRQNKPDRSRFARAAYIPHADNKATLSTASTTESAGNLKQSTHPKLEKTPVSVKSVYLDNDLSAYKQSTYVPNQMKDYESDRDANFSNTSSAEIYFDSDDSDLSMDITDETPTPSTDHQSLNEAIQILGRKMGESEAQQATTIDTDQQLLNEAIKTLGQKMAAALEFKGPHQS